MKKKQNRYGWTLGCLLLLPLGSCTCSPQPVEQNSMEVCTKKDVIGEKISACIHHHVGRCTATVPSIGTDVLCVPSQDGVTEQRCEQGMNEHYKDELPHCKEE